MTCYFCGSDYGVVTFSAISAERDTGYLPQVDLCEDCDGHLESLINFGVDKFPPVWNTDFDSDF